VGLCNVAFEKQLVLYILRVCFCV